MASLHPTEHRGIRELFAFSRSLATHYDDLAEHLPPEQAGPFRSGAEEARELLRQLETHAAAYDLHGKPAAQGLGNSIGTVRAEVRNRFLETDRAARFALSEIAYLVGLLAYLRRVAETRNDARSSDFCAGWQHRMEEVERNVRAAAAELGADPDTAMQPYDTSVLGRALQSVGFVLGSVGEWTDRQAAKRG
jgi:hypothetical protein